jgi:hypothetical protein
MAPASSLPKAGHPHADQTGQQDMGPGAISKRRNMKTIENFVVTILCFFFGKCKLPRHYRRSQEQRLMIHLLRDGKA